LKRAGTNKTSVHPILKALEDGVNRKETKTRTNRKRLDRTEKGTLKNERERQLNNSKQNERQKHDLGIS